jgi:outer membrane protein TolC
MKLQRFFFYFACLVAFNAALQPVVVAQSADTPQPASPLDINLLSQGRSAFPFVWHPYRPAPLPPVDSSNGPIVSSYISQGKLALSLSQFLQLVVENNLAIEAARYNYLIAQVDLLRTRSGSAARGVPSVPVPGAFFAGAIGAGVGNIVNVTSNGTGSTAISGGANSGNVGPRGTFDPTFSINASWDHVTDPLNTTKVSGTYTVTSPTAVLQTRWQQEMPWGTGYSFSFNMQRQATTQAHILYNPSWTSFFSISIYHPLMNGASRAFTQRFVTLAENDRRIAYVAFAADMNSTLVPAANAYWDFSAARERERVADRALALAETIYESTKQRIEIGTLASTELITAEAQVAASKRDLIIARTNTQLQEVALKNLITKSAGQDIAVLPLEPTDALAASLAAPIPPLEDALRSAMRRAPIRQAELGLENQRIAETFTQSNLRPTLSVFTQFNSYSLAGRPAGALTQMWQFAYPEYSAGLTLTFAVKNRSAQADDIRARIERQRAEVAFAQTKANVGIQVRTALTNSAQTRAQVEAAQRAVQASQQTADAEQVKWGSGFSTLATVYQTQLDLVRAQIAEIQSRLDYAKAIIAQETAVGNFLESHNIGYDKALQGRLWRDSTKPPPASPSGDRLYEPAWARRSRGHLIQEKNRISLISLSSE